MDPLSSTVSADEMTTRRRRGRKKTRTRPTKRPKDGRRGRGSRRRGRRTTTMTTMTPWRGPARLPCTEAEKLDKNCLNHGECFVVIRHGHLRVPACRCVGIVTFSKQKLLAYPRRYSFLGLLAVVNEF